MTVLEGGAPDRVPISTYELVGYNTRAWENNEPSYARLMERIRRDTECIAMWEPTRRVKILESSADVPMETRIERNGPRVRTIETVHAPGGDLRRVSEADDRVHTVWVVEHWCKSIEDVDRALALPYEPVDVDAGDFGRIRDEVGEHGIVMPSLYDPAYVAADLMSFEDYLIWAYEHREHFARTVEVLAERVMENLKRELSVCVADLYRICGPEYMTRPYMPPEMFAGVVAPHLKTMTRMIQERGAKVRVHCHGKIGGVLGMILDSGCDAIDPCEPPPDGDVELREVKKACAERGVCVMGNIELRLLESGTSAEVREAVRRCMDEAKEDGGYVLMPTAAPINVPLSPKTEANYVAYIDAGLEYGSY